MSDKPFTKYLLRLATDAKEVERFRQGGEVAHISMDAANLSREQQRALLEGDEKEIDAFVRRELLQAPAGERSVAIPFICLIERGGP